jgi:putative chitobiose transport system substrate-binding protein
MSIFIPPSSLWMRITLRGARCLLLVLSVALISSAHASSAREPVRVGFWTMQLSPFHDAYIKGVIKAFEAQHPNVRVDWVDVPWSEMEKKTLTAVAASSPARPAPDVVNLNPQFASKLAEFGALADPERYLKPETINAFLPAVWNANRLDGKAFAMPWYLTTSVVLVNRQILAAARVSVPKTYESLLPAAREIRRNTGKFAYFPALDGAIPLETLVGMGAPLLSGDGCSAGFTNASGERVFALHRDLYRDGLVPRNVVTEGHRKAVEMFLSGQVAMISSGMQFLQSIRINNPGIYAHVDVLPQWSAPEPGGTAGAAGAAGGAGAHAAAPNIAMMNIAVMQSSANKEAAFAFAAFLTNTENQTAFAKRVPILPSTRASYDDAFFSKSSGDALLDRARAISVAQVKEGRVLVPPMRRYSKFRSDYARNLQAVMLGRKDIPTAFADIDRVWRDLLGCRGGVAAAAGAAQAGARAIAATPAHVGAGQK